MKILHPSRGLDDTKDMSRVTEEYFLIYGNRNDVACLQSEHFEVSAASISHRQLIIHRCPAFADEVGGEIVVAKDNFHPNYSVCQSVRQGFQV